MIIAPAVMGVDPGVRGGLSVLDEKGRPALVETFKPQMMEYDLVAVAVGAARRLMELGGVNVYFEKVGFIRGDGGQGSFTFGRVDGLLRGALRASGCQLHDVRPTMWQMKMGCLTGGNKNISKQHASVHFPEIKITHGNADSLLIAYYGRTMSAL
jgi:hypothetical protein